jgi:pimeloyl-ACP methyl ester carboxylesterase
MQPETCFRSLRGALARYAAVVLAVIAVAPTAAPLLAQGSARPAFPPPPAAGGLPAGVAERMATIGGVNINYKIGGRGPVVVLLHGFAETSHMWMPLMPLLTVSRTVIAPDLRGAGGSDRSASGYDKKTLAQDIRGLVHQLGRGGDTVTIVGHDIGLMVAYAYAAQYPAEVDRVVLMDAFLPGVGDWKNVWLARDLWHFHFFGRTPEALVKGRERTYLDHFWNDFAADETKSISEADRQLYATAYARADSIRATFQYFKSFEQDAKDFEAFAKTKLQMPMLVLTGEKASGPFLIDQAKLVATNVRGVVVEGAGHWLMEEAPRVVIPELVAFITGARDAQSAVAVRQRRVGLARGWRSGAASGIAGRAT